jgi:hypothetical protein
VLSDCSEEARYVLEGPAPEHFVCKKLQAQAVPSGRLRLVTYEDRYRYAVEHHVCDQGWICEQHPDRPYPHDLRGNGRGDSRR